MKDNEMICCKKSYKFFSALYAIMPVVYIPLSIVSFLLFMASESTMYATDLLYIDLILIFSYVSLAIPFLCILCISASSTLRKCEKTVAAMGVQMLPLLIFLLNIAFLAVIECIFR